MTMKAILVLVGLVPTLCFGQGEPAKQTARPVLTATSTNSLVREIKEMDTRLFDAIFKDCDLAHVKDLVTDDFEFYHDRGGLIATNRAQFVDIRRKTCERQKSGQERRSRRELITMEVYPLSGYGAIQTGVHRFFIIRENQVEEAGDIAKFTHVWRKVGDGWRIARVLSYDLMQRAK
jgi:ketosteroid isomerase-like protein